MTQGDPPVVPQALLDPAFGPLMAGVDRARLEADPRVCCGLWADLRIGWVNPAWWARAREGGARWRPGEWGPGDDLARCLPDPLRDFYRAGFRRVVETGVDWEHDYECPTPTRGRTFRMRVSPLAGGQGLLVVHALRVERAAPADAAPGGIEGHLGAGGLLALCCHCRRTRRGDDERVWDWVPAALDFDPKRVSHGICGTCRALYYKS